MIFRLTLILLSIILFIPQLIILLVRVVQKKEDSSRFFERLAIGQASKLETPLWLHAASVGESNIALTLIDILSEKNPKLNFLVTTGTIASAYNIEQKKSPLTHVVHQFLPMDNFFTAKIFVNYWKPRALILIESEIWPNIICAASDIMPVMIANGVMSERSYKRWSKLPSFMKWLGGKFSCVLAQAKKDEDHFTDLGFNNVILAGNIKYVSKKQKLDKELVRAIQRSSVGKDVILASSTHEGDEELIIQSFKTLRKKRKNLLLIIAPRHINRLKEVLSLCDDYNVKARSLSGAPDQNTDIFILDTIGEMHNIFSLKPIVIMGGSFNRGGHNILEPALYECPIIFGPDMSNFREISEEFLSRKAAIRVQGVVDLTATLETILSSSDTELDEMTDRAFKIIELKQKIGDLYREEIIRRI